MCVYNPHKLSTLGYCLEPCVDCFEPFTCHFGWFLVIINNVLAINCVVAREPTSHAFLWIGIGFKDKAKQAFNAMALALNAFSLFRS